MLSLETLFDWAIVVTVGVLMIATGLIAEPGEIANCFRGRRLWLGLRVVLANILVIPFAVLLALALFDFDRTFAQVLFLLAIAPAAPLIPTMVSLNRGDANWALSLMLSLTAISLFSIPCMVRLGRFVLADGVAMNPVSAGRYVGGYVIPVLVPLAGALALKIYARSIAERIQDMVQRLVGILSVLLLVLVIVMHRRNLAALSLSTSLSLMAIVVVFSCVGGVAIIPNAIREQYTAAIITTGFRNFVVIMLLVNMLSPDRSALLQIIPVFVFTMAIFVCAGMCISRRPAARGRVGQ